MENHSLAHLSDETLARELPALGIAESTVTARLLRYIAEFEARWLYVASGFPSMVAYLMATLPHLCDTEHVAFNHIHAARCARDYPVIFTLVADGRLSLTAVNLLAPYLTPENAEPLLTAASGKTKVEVQCLLAARFPKPDLATVIEPAAPVLSGNRSFQNECDPVALDAADTLDTPAPPPRVTPLSAERFGLQVTIDRETHDLLHHLQALLGRTGSRQVAEVLKDALRCYARDVERRKFGATDRPRRCRMTPSDSRHVPAEVKRAVWERDGGQCTYTSPNGHRCEARTRVEFDHIDAYARGGVATAGNIRLRCRAHNQYEAERTYAAEFIRNKREQVRLAAAEKKEAKARAVAERNEAKARAAVERKAAVAEQNEAKARAAAAERAKAAAEQDPECSVIPWLRSMGFRLEEARRGAAACANAPDAPLEQRVRIALSSLTRAHGRADVTGRMSAQVREALPVEA